MKYLHTGIPLAEKLEGMVFVEPLKVWLKTEPAYAVEFLYFEIDSPMAAAVQECSHVAYDVEDIDAALAGKSILWPKFDIGDAFIAFVYDKECVVEFYQKKK